MTSDHSNATRILVAEDSDVYARLIETVLTKAGFEVVRVSDGLQAYDAIVRGPAPALLITDILMPALSGFELLAKLNEEGRMVPTVVLTSKQGEESVLRGLNYGALDYIGKPFSPSELLARIRLALKAKQGA